MRSFVVGREFLLRPRERLRSIVMSMSVCGCGCARGYLRNHTRHLYQIFVHVAYFRGSVLLRHVYDRPHRLSTGKDFLPFENALSPGKGGWECTARAKYAIYDCIVKSVASLAMSNTNTSAM